MSVPVSVIIPNWNGAHHLPTCLDSLQAQTHLDTEVIVVDNASTDGSQALVAEHYPEIRLIALPENHGFTGACNAGLQAGCGEILALLNNDTEAAPTWIEAIVAAAEHHPEAGMIASKMLLFDRRDVFHTAGDFYRVDGIPGNRGVWQTDTGQYDVEEYVFSACGGAAAYRRAMLGQIGLLDNDFFFSCEDIDLAWRAQLSGWRCVYAPQAIVYHRLAATGGGPTASFYSSRNMLWVIAKNYPGPLARKYWRHIVRAQWRRAWEALKAWQGEAARATLRGILTGLWTLPRALHKRRQIQAKCSASLEYIESILTPLDG